MYRNQSVINQIHYMAHNAWMQQRVEKLKMQFVATINQVSMKKRGRNYLWNNTAVAEK
jgi:hypothetical protein